MGEGKIKMNTTLWQPTPAQIKASNMQRFMTQVEKKYQINLPDYSALYQWSIQEPEQFWSAVWEFCNIKASKTYTQVLTDPKKMPGAKWFTGAQLNFAKNLLSRRDDHPALIYRDEQNKRCELSYSELYNQVEKLSAAFKQTGITVGDRVVGFLPNLPETVIAMLATTSLGAIWSGCSPDFGVNAVVDRFGQISPKILLTTDGYYYKGKINDSLEKAREISAQLPSLEHIIVIPNINAIPDLENLPKAQLYADFIAPVPAQPLEFVQLPFDHPVYILYSSGTTGVPKCIVHGAGGTLIQHLKELVLHTDLKPEDVFFYFTTCTWMMWHWLISGLAVGATIVLYEGSPFHPQTILLDLIDAEKITIFGTSAKYISAIDKAGLCPRETQKLTSLKTILSTGSPLLPENFDYVYAHIKTDLRLSSISGGTDIISCFVSGNPLLPVYRGELQSIDLGLNVQVYNEAGKPVKGEPGELVCTAPFPCMPLYFWQDPEGQKYHAAYFEQFPEIWAQGDFAEITEHDGVIIYGRSDAVLNPGGVRIGTAEIYRQVEQCAEVLESLAIGQDWQGDVRVILFVVLRENLKLTPDLIATLKKKIKNNTTARHVPAKIIQVPELPRTANGKLVEIAVRDIVHGRLVKNRGSLANPQTLDFFKDLAELQMD